MRRDRGRMTDETARAATAPRLALSIPNMAEPSELVELGIRAEASGWDGVFLWDHAHGSPEMPVPVADPWVVLGALATRTERITLGTAVTPAARRRPQKLARETVTVDHLSGGRMVLGVGLGEPPEEYTAYGEDADRRLLAARLDESLEVLAQMWSGEPFSHHGPHHTVEDARFLPTPVQRPRIPVWAACIVPHTRPLRRAARWDGVVLGAFDEAGGLVPVPPDEVRRAVEAIARHRGPGAGPFDVAISHSGIPGDDELATYAEAGVTWVMATGWVDQLADLVDLAATRVAPPAP
jgi:alkanesulfonate monooxygenase SsuD/methylene tetrahydromethanopterin reductase-like flavin-dependent oxidoreductase (luciferase family)